MCIVGIESTLLFPRQKTVMKVLSDDSKVVAVTRKVFSSLSEQTLLRRPTRYFFSSLGYIDELERGRLVSPVPEVAEIL